MVLSRIDSARGQPLTDEVDDFDDPAFACVRELPMGNHFKNIIDDDLRLRAERGDAVVTNIIGALPLSAKPSPE